MAGESQAALPVGWLLDADAFVRERRTIFAEAWQMIARVESFRAPGDYVCQNLAGLAVIAMRSATGQICAFRNSCRHRKLPVLDAGAGNCRLLRCRYHGWTYRFDGTFAEAPAQYSPRDRTSGDNDLPRLPLVNWRDFVFVAPEGDSVTFAAEIMPIETEIERIAAGSMTRISEITTDFDCNWKVPIEHWLAKSARDAHDGFDWLYLFPTLMLQARADSLIAHQLVVRSFDRTCVVSYILARDPASGDGLVNSVRTVLANDKRMCHLQHAEAGQSGTIGALRTDRGTALGDFRARVRAAHKSAEALS